MQQKMMGQETSSPDLGLVFPPRSTNQPAKDLFLRCVSMTGALLNTAFGCRDTAQFGILMYHRVTNVAGQAPPTMNITPQQLHKQLAGLVLRGYVFWPLDKLITFRRKNWTIPPRVSAVTFDCGFAGVYHNAWPILQKLRIPATVFISTAYLDTGEPLPCDHWGLENWQNAPAESYLSLSTDQCREMQSSGLITIGTHTHTHQDFRGRPDAFREDLRRAVDIITTQFGESDVPFAFPYSMQGLDSASRVLINMARGTGVSCVLNTCGELIPPNCAPFHWGRVNALPWDNGASLAAKLSGWYSWEPRLCQPAPSHELIRQDVSTLFTGTRELVSVIVPTYNRADWLQDALNSLLSLYTGDLFDYEIIVVDNNSTDTTQVVVDEVITSQTVPLRYFSEEKRGDAPPRNRGIRAAKGKWLAFFDDDQLADPKWLYELLRTAKFLDAEIVGGNTGLDLPREELENLHTLLRQILRESDNKLFLQPFSENSFPGTGNVLIAKAVFNEIGLFDTSMDSGASDFGFFLRARKAGFALWYCPHASLLHRVPASRLLPDNVRIESLRGGAIATGHIDLNSKGKNAMIGYSLLRVLKAAVVHIPTLIFALITGDTQKALAHKSRIWRAEGYCRRTLALHFPKFFHQRQFFQSLRYIHLDKKEHRV